MAATGTAAEIAALQDALAAEHAAVYGYGVAGALLSGADLVHAKAGWRAHQLARDNLAAMLTRLGASPVASSAAYDLPFAVSTPAAARRLAADLENGVTRAYLAMVAVSNENLRFFAAKAMQTAAVRATAWRGSTVAFPGMAG
jgi:uncharacterized protein DUF4439